MIPRVDPESLKLRARAADELLNDVAFAAAVQKLHAQWYAELMNEKDDNKVRDLVAKLRALEAIPQLLDAFRKDPQLVRRTG